MRMFSRLSVLSLVVCLTSCSSEKNEVNQSVPPPVFSLAWSEYPSWSTFGVAHELGLINGEAGKLGPIEEKYNVDIKLVEIDYDSCIQQLGQGLVDAACITNIDAIAPAKQIDLVAFLPTSTSVGGDGLLVENGINFENLSSKHVLGLEKSVSQYVFWRCLENRELNPQNFTWENKDPGIAAQGMSQKQNGFEVIMVWNPFKLQTERNRSGEITVLLNSSEIPEEVIDQVVASKSSLNRDGGKRFAKAVCTAFYAVNNFLENDQTRETTLVKLGERFSNLSAEDMEIVTKQTRFYETPEAGIALYTGQKIKDTQSKVEKFAVDAELVDKPPTVGFDQKETQLNFTPEFMQSVQD